MHTECKRASHVVPERNTDVEPDGRGGGILAHVLITQIRSRMERPMAVTRHAPRSLAGGKFVERNVERRCTAVGGGIVFAMRRPEINAPEDDGLVVV